MSWSRWVRLLVDQLGWGAELTTKIFPLESEEFPGWDPDTFLEGIDSRQRILLSELEDVFTDFSSQLR